MGSKAENKLEKNLGKKVSPKTAVSLKPKKSQKKVTEKVKNLKKVNLKKPKTSSNVKKITTENVTEEIKVPSSASLRLLEKVELYKMWYDETLPRYVTRATKVAGYAFVFVGIAFASFGYLADKDLGLNAAALLCSTSLCDEVVDTQLTPQAPEVDFLNSLPRTLESNNDILVQVSNSNNVDVYLNSVTDGSQTSLKPVEEIELGKYRYLIPGSSLSSGTYIVSAATRAENGIEYFFKGPEFQVVDKEVEVTALTQLSLELVQAENISTTTDLDSSTSTDEGVEVEAEVEPEDGEEVTEVPLPDLNKDIFSVRLEKNNGAEFLEISTGNFAPDTVQVYGVVPGSQNRLYLGEATLVQSIWYLSMSALELPSRQMFIYAAFSEGNTEIQSTGINYRPNLTVSQNSLRDEDLAILVKKVNLALEDISSSNEARLSYFSSNNSIIDSSTEDQLIDSTQTNIIEQALNERSEELDYLTLTYAASLQTDSSFLTVLAKDNLVKYYKNQLYASINEKNGRYLNSALETVFLNRLDILLSQIEQKELQLKQSSNNLIARDTDYDGISDYDELINFKTNPSVADTDQDGIIDGVEVINLFDPQNSDVSQNPDPANSLKTQVTQTSVIDLLSIEQQIIKDQNKNEKFIYNVQGKTLPNAHTHIISKNSGIIGITKSNDVGNFSYSLENQPANLPVTVVAALPNNEGKLVVSSNEFTYSAKNTNLSAAALNGLESEISREREKIVSSSIIIGSVGLVALGFILLLLAQMIKARRKSPLLVEGVK